MPLCLVHRIKISSGAPTLLRKATSTVIPLKDCLLVIGVTALRIKRMLRDPSYIVLMLSSKGQTVESICIHTPPISGAIELQGSINLGANASVPDAI